MSAKMEFPSYEDAKKIVMAAGIKSQKEYRAKYKGLGLPSNPNGTYKEEWIDWPSFLGKETIAYPSYEVAKGVVMGKGIMSASEYRAKYKELGLPSCPYNFYKDKGWIDWASFLGKEEESYLSFKEVKKIVAENGIMSSSEYNAKYKELGLPSSPHTTYKDKGWIDWDDFFGREKKSCPSYEEAHKTVIEAGIKSGDEYRAKCKELGLPSHPERNYKDKGWSGLATFLGKESIVFPPYEEAKGTVIEAGIKSIEEYRAKNKELGLPSSPHVTYKDKGWINWDEFFERPHIVSHKERKAKVLSKLALNPILLDDKAPLQVIYMVASCVDKELAKEIEALLDSSSSEDRLNWVKEQLKDVKEETMASSGATSSSPDEVSAMVSMMEIFEDTFDDLSEEDTTSINTILENYYHNVVNKELIAEYDG